jgi:GAF domain-containing protein
MDPRGYTAQSPGDSPQRTAEKELRDRVRQQEATGRLGLAALSGMSLSDLMDEAVKVVAGVLAVEYCKILELVPDGTALLLRAGVGWKEGIVGTTTVGTNLQSQAGYALISKEPVVVEDLRSENRFEDGALLREHGVVSGLSTTVHVSGRPYGVLSAHTRRRRAFTEDEVLFLQEVAEVLNAPSGPPPRNGASPSWPRPTHSSLPPPITGPC